MQLDSLLLSKDVELVRVLRPTLEKMSIEVEVCQDPRAATDVLVSEKFDAIIVDCDDLQGGLTVLEGLRNTPSNRNSVAFAVLNGHKTTTQQAFGMGANFVMQKPISILNASRCFHAALNFMIKERRRYFRHPVKIQVKVTVGDREFKATSTNLSEGGMALALREALPKGASPHVQFQLPDTGVHLNLESEIAWADINGRAGLKFRNVPETTLAQLEKWLDDRMEEEFPGAKERMAASDPDTH